MKSFKSLSTFLLAGLFLIAASTTALAAGSWVTDAKTGIRIGWASDAGTLTAASWSGPSVEGKAEGKGNIELTILDKAGKTFQGQGEAEMRAGLLDGKVTLKWSDGTSYDVYFKTGSFAFEGRGTMKWPDGTSYDGEWKNGSMNGKGMLKLPDGNVYDGDLIDGKFEGKGTYKWTNGNVYEGEWGNSNLNGVGTYKWTTGEVYTGTYKNGLRNGYGVQKDSGGKVIYEGEWKDDKQLAAPLKADKILGIPWGATEDEAKRIMLQRPKTTYFNSSKTATNKWQIYVGPYNDETAKIDVGFYQEKMYQVGVHLYADEDKIMDLFNYVKSGLTERYGAPFEERGKYLDTKIFWDLGEGYQAALVVGKNEIPQLPASWGPSQLPWRFPFEVSVYYGHPSTSEKTKKPAGKDF